MTVSHAEPIPWTLASVDPSLDVSVVVVNYNTCDALCGCLRSVWEHADGVRLEVIVVDNASSDHSGEMVAADFPQVRLIANSRNRGFAAGCNQGMAVARGRYVLLLNPDTLVLDGTLAQTVAFAETHRDAAVVGCQCVGEDGRIARYCFRYPSLLNTALEAFLLHRIPWGRGFFGREWMADWDRTTEREVEVVSGSYLLVRREAIEEVGLMDEDYFLYAEEADWCYRFTRAGWKIIFTPAARYVHLGRRSTRQRPVAMGVQRRKSVLLFFEKHRGRTSRAIANALFAASAFWRMLAWEAVALAGRVRRGRSARASDQCAELRAALQFHLFGREPQRL